YTASETTCRDEPGAAAASTGLCEGDERTDPDAGRNRPLSTHRLLRTGVSYAAVRTGSDRPAARDDGDEKPLRAGRYKERGVRDALSVGAASGGARRSVCAVVLWRRACQRAVGRARQYGGESREDGADDRQTDCRTAERPQ